MLEEAKRKKQKGNALESWPRVKRNVRKKRKRREETVVDASEGRLLRH
jgi:hypothetical protein